MTQTEDHNNPGPNPSRGENPENALYQAWKAAEAWERPDIEYRLLQLLRRHASKVCWMVLHSHQPDLIDEISQDALMDLASFEERSAFATWFHARALNRCRTKRKQNIQRKEVPLDVETINQFSVPRESSLLTKVIVQEMLDKLTPFERELVDLKVFEGLTDTQVAAKLGYTHEWIQKLWSNLRNRLKDTYNGVV